MGERTEWAARGGKTVQVDYPGPARTVVLTLPDCPRGRTSPSSSTVATRPGA